jgi:hypothetical protein
MGCQLQQFIGNPCKGDLHYFKQGGGSQQQAYALTIECLQFSSSQQRTAAAAVQPQQQVIHFLPDCEGRCHNCIWCHSIVSNKKYRNRNTQKLSHTRHLLTCCR